MPRPLQAIFRAFVFLFFKIKEPRIIRLVQFIIYACMVGAGHFIVTVQPELYTNVLGTALVVGFGGAILLGGTLGAIAVLPGIWWLERTAIIALWTGLGIFVVVQVALAISIVGLLIAVALAASFVQRWSDITEFDLAPRAS
jgi:hypothetical protein